ncbi:MAG: RNA polymerase sigma factor [Planctomycetes bacterium]|nr:RNA polymerase sigma factor [Planctomycetota bacterium]
MSKSTPAAAIALPGPMPGPGPGPAPSPTSDAATADALVHTHLRAVWRYLRWQGASPHEADDLTQEAFVVALQKGAADLEPAATAAFLRRTARFLFLRHRRGRDAEQLADAVDELWQRHAAHDGGEGLLDALRECLGELTDRARRAVELGYGLGANDRLGRVDLGKELGLAPDGVKTLMQRVRQQLRACIERRYP